ncbi:hypothetical protein, variant [Verruconis gallopava]|uniref:DUF2293 domain-containing protein n=1 Tax=Verruconis gallopava TaxID=253628 RepID=A0A0D1XHT2_9PEZI|nr:uncharacterized protein PV09_06661 [Verruconis gallopava]XP_016211675.1 hypothetical protein, variant [Verruconis gallopava]KIW01805.1 hypothetical protein PV09_06661 [Verruconis gallopava]KIW01806.1 hypothetical protein, variant [Verruconis gallopava]
MSTTLIAPMSASRAVGVHQANSVYNQFSTIKRLRHDETFPSSGEPPAKRYKYKTTMTEVQVKKKPLELKYDSNVPSDYSLVKYGRKDVTEFLLNLSRKHKKPVWVANSTVQSQRAEAQAPDTSRSGYHVGRVGYYFHKDLIANACKWFEIRIQGGQIKDDRNAHRPKLTKNDLKACLEEIYPHIPDRDRNTIIGRLNPKNGSSIGKAANLNPYKQVELAVISHIRHAHTDYDKLLRYGNKNEARKSIQPELLAKLAEWKGEDKKDEWDTEFQEVVNLEEEPEVVLEEDDEHYSPPLPQDWVQTGRSTETPGVLSRPSTRHHEVEQPNPSRDPSPAHFGTHGLQGYQFRYRPLPQVVDLTNSSPIRPGVCVVDESPKLPQHYTQPHPNGQHPAARLYFRKLSPTEELPPPPLPLQEPRAKLHRSERLSWVPRDEDPYSRHPLPPPPVPWNASGTGSKNNLHMESSLATPIHPNIHWRPLPPVNQPAIRLRPLPGGEGEFPALPSDMRFRPVTPENVLPSREPHSPLNPRMRTRPAGFDDYPRRLPIGH